MTTCTVCTINVWWCVATMKNRVQLSPPSRLSHTSPCSSRDVFSGAGQREPCLEAFTLRVAPGSLTLWLVHPPDHSLSNALSLLLAVRRSDESRVEQPHARSRGRPVRWCGAADLLRDVAPAWVDTRPNFSQKVQFLKRNNNFCVSVHFYGETLYHKSANMACCLLLALQIWLSAFWQMGLLCCTLALCELSPAASTLVWNSDAKCKMYASCNHQSKMITDLTW